MSEVSQIRLYVMRAMYLVTAVGLGLTIWPLIVTHRLSLPVLNGVSFAMLGAVALLAIIGIRYPLQMLPVLLFELVWKTIWLTAFALPMWTNGQLTEDARSTVFDCSFGVVLLLVIPWRYVFDNYVAKPGDRWRRTGATSAAADEA